MDKSATQLVRSHYVSRERHVTVRRLHETSLVNPMLIILAQRHKIRPAISITRIGPGLRYVVTERVAYSAAVRDIYFESNDLQAACCLPHRRYTWAQASQ